MAVVIWVLTCQQPVVGFEPLMFRILSQMFYRDTTKFINLLLGFQIQPTEFRFRFWLGWFSLINILIIKIINIAICRQSTIFLDTLCSDSQSGTHLTNKKQQPTMKLKHSSYGNPFSLQEKQVGSRCHICSTINNQFYELKQLSVCVCLNFMNLNSKHLTSIGAAINCSSGILCEYSG